MYAKKEETQRQISPSLQAFFVVAHPSGDVHRSCMYISAPKFMIFCFHFHRTLPKMFLKQAAITTGLSLVVKMVTPFIPTFLYDILVSWMLCISPFEAFNRFFRQFGQLINWNNPQQPEARPEENRDNRAWHFNFQIG